MLKYFTLCFLKHKKFEANERDLGLQKAHIQSNQLRGFNFIYFIFCIFI